MTASRFVKGQSGNPAGKPKGTKSKIRYDVAEILKETGCNPFKVLSDLALTSDDEKIRCAAASTLAKYVAPQLKQIEHKTEEGSQFSVNISMAPVSVA